MKTVEGLRNCHDGWIRFISPSEVSIHATRAEKVIRQGRLL